jgi:aspartate kinase
MIIFKFGGASVKDAGSVKNLAAILKTYTENMVVVVSAMGKTTNALENLTEKYFQGSPEKFSVLESIKEYHYQITKELSTDINSIVYRKLDEIFDNLKEKLQSGPSLDYHYEYDQIVSYGEIISTTIIDSYLNNSGIKSEWVDVRKCLKTDSNYREAQIDFVLSEQCARNIFTFEDTGCYITQGFIGSDSNNLTTTLGREGSDYTAAVLAYLLGAEHITIWKDVPGVLNADPKWFDNTVKLDYISYLDAIELAYYGTSVIHPKTIQPLQKKGIKLQVRSFLDPSQTGTIIGDKAYEKLIPSFIFKMDQVLMQIFPRDFSFIAEDNLEKIFGSFARYGLRMNLMQNSAVSFKVCVNNDQTRLPKVIEDLEKLFNVSYENGLELITIRYYDAATIDRVMVDKELLLEQKNKKTIQLVVRDTTLKL